MSFKTAFWYIVSSLAIFIVGLVAYNYVKPYLPASVRSFIGA